MTSAHQDALSLAATLNPGILARALDCEKTVAAHPHNPDALALIKKAGESYRRQLADVAALIEPVLAARDARIATAISHLINLQPHIASLMKHQRPFIDNHVDAALEALQS